MDGIGVQEACIKMGSPGPRIGVVADVVIGAPDSGIGSAMH